MKDNTESKAKQKSARKSIFSVSCAATLLTVLYLCFSALNLYKLMYPLAFLDIKSEPDSNLVGPLWEKGCNLQMKLYLSTKPQFGMDFLKADYPAEDDEHEPAQGEHESMLLWEEEISRASISKSFLLTMLDCEQDRYACQQDASCRQASEWLDHAENALSEGGLLSELSVSAGEGIQSTSVLLIIYDAISRHVGHFLAKLGLASENDEDNVKDTVPERKIISLSPSSPIWAALQSNVTLRINAVITRDTTGRKVGKTKPATLEEAGKAIQRSVRANSILMDNVDLIKYDQVHHINPPGRILYHDILYLLKKYVVGGLNETARPPWDMAYSKPEEFGNFQNSLVMKEKHQGYPYWKPEVAVKYVNDFSRYPTGYVGFSGMELVRLPSKTREHPTGFAQMPFIHVDEIGLTSEKYIPVNETLTSLPLRVSFDRNDMEQKHSRATANAGGISPARWRLLTHFSNSLESQKELGFEQSDIDDLRRLIADTNVLLLSITMIASCLHLLFEFLTFKNDVTFWKNNKDLTGLSVRSLFLDMIGQVIILLFLIEKDSSLLMTVPSGVGCLIALWKCQRGAGFKFIRIGQDEHPPSDSWWNVLPRMFGYELRATRLHIAESAASDESKAKGNLAALTIETDRIATRTLGSVLLPVVVAFTIYLLVNEEHTGWYSWLITSASSAVYALGFVLMTPQLFLNYKLKSVAHLPWRVLIYKFLNTFIDDLFAFIIRMPTMARISCFRDDIVFIIYLYQRWLYPVDSSRPVEGGDASEPEPRTSLEKKKQ